MVSGVKNKRLLIVLFMAGMIACVGACIPSTIENDIERARSELARQATRAASLATMVASQDAEIGELEESIERQYELITYLATRVPLLPRPTAMPAEPTPYRPVLGGVVLEDGRCCAGGKVGEVIQISVEFHAESPDASVVKMRYRLGRDEAGEEDLAQIPWQPFAERQTVAVQVALNWVGYTLSVQFMDDAGNLSMIYHDEISIEGSP
jgi:hypothetical protein